MTIPSVGTATFLFTDIEGSTRLWERNQATMQYALARHDEILYSSIKGHGGHVFKTFGDAFCAVFPTAPAAVEGAIAAQRALYAEEWHEHCQIRTRMALHTGTIGDHDGDYFGPAVNRVARLLTTAHGGQILLSLATQELVRECLTDGAELRDLGERRLKDLVRPERVFQLVVPGLTANFPPLKTLDARLDNLPVQPTPLIGREREVTEVCGLLRRDEVRLLSLTGTGGTGKTRLSLQAAAEMTDEFEDGVFFVALAPLRDPDLVASTIAQPLGVTETSEHTLEDRLKAYLCDRELLLVLDNFEQVLEAAPLVGELLAYCPGLKFLVTSRIALDIYGERKYMVPPLRLPDLKRLPSIERLTRYEAVRLFIEQARAFKTNFAVTNENAPAVAEICVRLDGLPLAIELAAARSKPLTPQAMLKRLGNRLKLLRGGARDLPARQQTLRGAIDWSHELLDEEERTLFRRLSVFAGGFTLEVAEAVCNVNGDLGTDVLEGVESLLDKSLLRQEEQTGQEMRFYMLETIREYARERLEHSGEEGEVGRLHASYYLAFAEGAEQELKGARQSTWAELLKVERGNLRAALSWSLKSGDPELGLRLGGALWWFWYGWDYTDEGRRWLEEGLKRDLESRTAVRAKALSRAGFLAMVQNDSGRARTLAEESLALGRELEEGHATAVSLATLGYVALFEEDYSRAEELFREALAVFRELSDKRDVGWGLYALGMLEHYKGDYDEAKALYDEILVRCEAVGDMGLRMGTLCNLGDVCMLQGDYERAKALFQESLISSQRLGNKRFTIVSMANLGCISLFEGDHSQATAFLKDSLALSREQGHWLDAVGCLELLAGVAGARGEALRASRLWIAAGTLRETFGSSLPPGERALLEPYIETACSQSEEVAQETARAEGGAMTLEEAIAYALEQAPDGATQNDGDERT